MAILEVGAHIGGITDEVVSRIRPATSRLAEAARVSSTVVDKLLRTPGSAPNPVATLLRPTRAYDRRASDVIVTRSVTRC